MVPTLPPQALTLRWHQEKYAQPGEVGPCDTQRRVAQALAQAEPLPQRADWAQRFESAMRAGLLPGGRIMAGAGLAERRATLMNCFVLPAQDLHQLCSQLRATLRAGGGVGFDLSDVPQGVLEVLNRCEAVAQSLERPPRAGRRAAQMAVLRADHPEIEAFIAAAPQAHPHLTRTVALDDAQMGALMTSAGLHRRQGSHLLARIAQAIWEGGEPGLLFISRLRSDDNLGDHEVLCATNPCGEQPLPPSGACALASIDLTRVVQEPFTAQARIAWGLLASLVHVGVRVLDNALDLSHWPLPQQAREMQRHRRIGLGITGLGDALALLNLHYAEPQARRIAAQLMRFIAHAAYRASVRLARERGAYQGFRAAQVLRPPHHASRLPADLQHDIRQHGLRHSHLLAIAPAASISVAFADNVSSGVEPMTAAQWQRHWRDPDGRACSAWVQGHAHRLWQTVRGPRQEPADGWAWLAHVSPEDQVAMVAALAPHVDGAISKTVSVPEDTPPEAIEALLCSAWRQGLKGVSVFRRGSRPGVLQVG